MSAGEGDEVRRAVRESYGHVASTGGSCCGPAASCCGPVEDHREPVSIRLGYCADDLAGVPAAADLSLGCGNPGAIAELKPGETVLDLGSGAGLDCFLAAEQVGAGGHVIGVDMTPEMVTRARANAVHGGYANVEFCLGEIEHLPVADGSVDVIISNCVINLSPDPASVFAEAARVLKPGGRLAISDVVAFAEIPEDVRGDLALRSACVSGASPVHEIERMLQRAGLEQIRVAPQDDSKDFMANWAPGLPITEFVVSATIKAVKPSA